MNGILIAFCRKTIYKYKNAISDLAQLLGRKLMKGNGLVGDLFDGWCCELRMNKYHFCDESVGLLGSDLHSDPSFLTIVQDDENVNGLQVVDKYSGEFVPLDHIPGSLVVNIGDIGKIWSNGRYCNVGHRVCCFEPKIRYSIALFMLGPNDTKVEAPSTLVDSNHPRLYVPVDFKEYRHVRTSRRAITGGGPDLFLFNSTP
ncbi:putative oxoglutarate/iron-dependent dioxygenase, isopenicillin N synthase [Helianthus anomalus]